MCTHIQKYQIKFDQKQKVILYIFENFIRTRFQLFFGEGKNTFELVKV